MAYLRIAARTAQHSRAAFFKHALNRTPPACRNARRVVPGNILANAPYNYKCKSESASPEDAKFSTDAITTGKRKRFSARRILRSASFKTRNATNAANLRARTEVPFHIKPHTCRNRKIRRLSARLPQNRKQTLPDTFQNKKRKIPFADADAKPLRENSALLYIRGRALPARP